MESPINQIICGDCLEIVKTFPNKSVDLVLTDPPYGIGADSGVGGFGESRTDKHYDDGWDNRRPSKAIFEELVRVGKTAIIFGGNFFTDYLPANGHWIVWDKTGGINFQNPFSDCELAWTNVAKKSVKKYIVIQQGFVAAEKVRYHPTQKPVQLFQAIIRDYGGELILDPFLGSGTTAVAAKMEGRNYIGIEISEKYCEIARRRVASAPVPLLASKKIAA